MTNYKVNDIVMVKDEYEDQYTNMVRIDKDHGNGVYVASYFNPKKGDFTGGAFRITTCDIKWRLDYRYDFIKERPCTMEELFIKAFKKIKEYHEIVQRNDLLTFDNLCEFMDEKPFDNLSDEYFEELITVVIVEIKRSWKDE